MKAFQFFIFVAIIAAVAAIVLSIPASRETVPFENDFSGGGIMPQGIDPEVHANPKYTKTKAEIDTLMYWGAISIPRPVREGDHVDIYYNMNPIRINISPMGKWYVQ